MSHTDLMISPEGIDQALASSPFVPGTRVQWAWDSTSLGWLKECPRKYYYHMVRGLVGRGEAVHLEFGILYHAALEHFDRLKFEGPATKRPFIAQSIGHSRPLGETVSLGERPRTSRARIEPR